MQRLKKKMFGFAFMPNPDSNLISATCFTMSLWDYICTCLGEGSDTLCHAFKESELRKTLENFYFINCIVNSVTASGGNL